MWQSELLYIFVAFYNSNGSNTIPLDKISQNRSPFISMLKMIVQNDSLSEWNKYSLKYSFYIPFTIQLSFVFWIFCFVHEIRISRFRFLSVAGFLCQILDGSLIYVWHIHIKFLFGKSNRVSLIIWGLNQLISILYCFSRWWTSLSRALPASLDYCSTELFSLFLLSWRDPFVAGSIRMLIDLKQYKKHDSKRFGWADC